MKLNKTKQMENTKRQRKSKSNTNIYRDTVLANTQIP